MPAHKNSWVQQAREAGFDQLLLVGLVAHSFSHWLDIESRRTPFMMVSRIGPKAQTT